MTRLAAILSLTTGLMILSACSTVPKTTSLTDGIDFSKSVNKPGVPLASDDPICTAFYRNIIDAAVKSQKAKRSNAQLASTGASVLTSMVGLGPVGSMATSSAARIAINQQISDVSRTEFDPKKKFDRKIIETAKTVGCPVSIKNAPTQSTP